MIFSVQGGLVRRVVSNESVAVILRLSSYVFRYFKPRHNGISHFNGFYNWEFLILFPKYNVGTYYINRNFITQYLFIFLRWKCTIFLLIWTFCMMESVTVVNFVPGGFPLDRPVKMLGNRHFYYIQSRITEIHMIPIQYIYFYFYTKIKIYPYTL